MEGQGSNSISSSFRPKHLAVSPIKVDSSLLRYLRSPAPARSPLAAIENFYTPPSRVFEVEEDVVVMDGILVGAVPPGNKSRSSSSSSSFGGSSAGSNCWQSPRLKVSHGKEELRPSRLPNKKRFDEKAIAKICTFNSPGPCSHGKCSFAHHLASESESPPYFTAVTTPAVSKISPMKLESSSKSYNNIDSFTLTNSDWSPFDDGIDISLPPSAATEKSPSREAVNAYINGVLYGDSRGKRLPVFAEFCPE